MAIYLHLSAFLSPKPSKIHFSTSGVHQLIKDRKNRDYPDFKNFINNLKKNCFPKSFTVNAIFRDRST